MDASDTVLDDLRKRLQEMEDWRAKAVAQQAHNQAIGVHDPVMEKRRKDAVVSIGRLRGDIEKHEAATTSQSSIEVPPAGAWALPTNDDLGATQGSGAYDPHHRANPSEPRARPPFPHHPSTLDPSYGHHSTGHFLSPLANSSTFTDQSHLSYNPSSLWPGYTDHQPQQGPYYSTDPYPSQTLYPSGFVQNPQVQAHGYASLVPSQSGLAVDPPDELLAALRKQEQDMIDWRDRSQRPKDIGDAQREILRLRKAIDAHEAHKAREAREANEARLGFDTATSSWDATYPSPYDPQPRATNAPPALFQAPVPSTAGSGFSANHFPPFSHQLAPHPHPGGSAFKANQPHLLPPSYDGRQHSFPSAAQVPDSQYLSPHGLTPDAHAEPPTNTRHRSRSGSVSRVRGPVVGSNARVVEGGGGGAPRNTHGYIPSAELALREKIRNLEAKITKAASTIEVREREIDEWTATADKMPRGEERNALRDKIRRQRAGLNKSQRQTIARNEPMLEEARARLAALEAHRGE